MGIRRNPTTKEASNELHTEISLATSGACVEVSLITVKN